MARRWTDTELTQAVLRNFTLAGVLRDLNLSTSPGNYRAIHGHINRLGLDTRHFTGQAHLRGKPRVDRRTHTLATILVERSHYKGPELRRRLVLEGLLENKCALCGTDPTWQGRPLTLQLDHINGNHLDNRIENLRILCPNCHTQTETFTSKKGQGRYAVPAQEPQPPNRCACGAEIERRSKRCEACMQIHARLTAKTKIQWPNLDELSLRVAQLGSTVVGRDLGVSEAAVRKHIRIHGAAGKI